MLRCNDELSFGSEFLWRILSQRVLSISYQKKWWQV